MSEVQEVVPVPLSATGMTHSENINELAAAMAKAQGAMKRAVKDSANPFFKSKYADLASVADACMPALAENGIAVIQGPRTENGDVVVDTTLCHSSGQWIRSSLSMKPVKADPQGIGSCITYARRYALAAMCGVAPEDDDGNAASGKTQLTAVEQQVKAAATKPWPQSRSALDR